MSTRSTKQQSIPVVAAPYIPSRSDLSMTTPFNYREVVEQVATSGSREVWAQVGEYLKKLRDREVQIVNNAERSFAGNPGSPNIAKLRMIRMLARMLYQEWGRVDAYLEKNEKANTSQYALWHKVFIDHNIQKEDQGRPYSIYDLLMIARRSIVTQRGYEDLPEALQLRGMGTLYSRNKNHIIAMPGEKGFELVVNGTTIEISGENLHLILSMAKNQTVQGAPFDAQCVMRSRSAGTWNGIAMILPAFKIVDLKGKEHNFPDNTRLLIHYGHYQAMFLSVAYARYGVEEYKALAETTKRCFGTADHVPTTGIDCIYWGYSHTYGVANPKRKEQMFLPSGLLVGLSEDIFKKGNLARFKKEFPAHKAATEQRRAENQAKAEARMQQQKATPPAPKATWQLPSVPTPAPVNDFTSDPVEEPAEPAENMTSWDLEELENHPF